MRRTRRLFIALLALFALIAFWLIGTNSGLRTIVARALPATSMVHLGDVQGSLWSGVVAYNIVVRTPTVHVEIEQAKADASLAMLLRGALRLRDVELLNARVQLLERATTTAAPRTAPKLPDLRVEALTIIGLDVERGDARWRVDRLTTRLALQASRVHLESLQVTAPESRLSGAVEFDLARAFALRTADLGFSTLVDVDVVQGVLRATSERAGTQLTLRLTQPVRAELRMRDIQSDGDWSASLQLAEQQWRETTPVAAALTARAVDGTITVQGSARIAELRAPAMQLHARLAGPGLVFASSTLDLAAPRGRVQFQGSVPFAANRPLALAAHSDALLLETTDAPPLRIGGDVVISGPRSALRFVPDLQLQRESWPSAQVSGSLSRSADGWAAEALLIAAGSGRLRIDGVLAARDDAPAELRLQLTQFDPALLLPEWPGAIDADLLWHGAYVAGEMHGRLQVDRVGGLLRDRALSGQGFVELSGRQLDAADLGLAIGATRLALKRSAASEPMQIELQSPDLADLMPDWRGRLALSASGDSTWRARAQADGLTIAGISLVHGQASATLGDGADAALDLNAQLSGLSRGAQRLDRLLIDVEGTRAAHRVATELQSGARQLRASVNGALASNSSWSGTLQELEVATPEGRAALREPAAFAYADGRVTLARACIVDDADGRICVNFEQQDGSGRAAIELVALDLQPLFTAFAADARLSAQARVNAVGDAEWRDGQLLSATVRVDSAEGAVLVSERPDLDLGFRDLVIDARLQGETGSWQASAAVRPEGRIESTGQLVRNDGQWQYDGLLRLHLTRFDLIEAFTSQLAAPRGDLSGEVQFRGRGSERPKLSGALAVTGFAAELPELGLELRDGALAIAAVPSGIIVRGAIQSGGGQLVLDGGRSAEAGARWHFALNGENAVLSDTPALRLLLSPALTLEQRADDWLLGGRVTIPEARIDTTALAPRDGKSSDVVIVDDIEDPNAMESVPWAADVTLVFGDKAQLIGYGFDGRVRGELRVRQRRGANAYGQGQLRVSGKYAAYGQRLTIRRGRLLFSNSPLNEPILDIEAERKAGTAVAGVRVTGSALRPQTEIYSRPALPESEALALIVTGRNVRSASGADRQRLSSAALALGTIGGDLLASNLGAEIGVTGDAARGTEAFTIGKYLTPKLFIGYGIGLARRGQVFIIRYLIREDVELEATSGEQARASLNYVIER